MDRAFGKALGEDAAECVDAHCQFTIPRERQNPISNRRKIRPVISDEKGAEIPGESLSGTIGPTPRDLREDVFC